MTNVTSSDAGAETAVSAAYTAKKQKLTRFIQQQNDPNVSLALEQDGQPGLFLTTTGGGLTINKMAHFFEQGLGEVGLIDHVPSGADTPISLPIADQISLRSLSLIHNRDLDTFELKFVVSWSETTTHKIDEGFELKQISLAFTIIGKNVSLVLIGILQIHEIELDVTLAIPSFVLEARLLMVEQAPADKKEKLIGKMVPGATGVPQKGSRPALQPELKSLKTLISLRQKRFMLHLEVENLLDLNPFELKLVQLDIMYAGGVSGASSTQTGRLFAEMDFELDQGKTAVILLAAELTEQKNWLFRGSLGPQGIAVGAVINTIAKKLGDTPPTLPTELQTLEMSRLDLSYDSGNKKFEFGLGVQFELGDGKTAVSILLTATNQGPTGGFDITGQLNAGGLLFTLELAKAKGDENSPASTYFVATYNHEGSDRALNITSLLADVDPDLGHALPPIRIDLKDVLFALSRPAITEPSANNAPKSTTHFIVGADLSAGFDLSHVPLLGRLFKAAPGQSLGIKDLKILYASVALALEEVTQINELLPSGVSQLPTGVANDNATANASGKVPTPIKAGLTLGATLDIGGAGTPLSLSAGGGGEQPSANESEANAGAVAALDGQGAAAQPSDNTTWFDIQKGLGPVYFEKVGVDYSNKVLWFRLSGSLALGGFTLALEGLSVGSPITKFEPKFDLKGLGVDIQGGPVEIGGMFLRFQAKAADGTPYNEYDGVVVVKTPIASLNAIGSYAFYEGHPSLFMYMTIEAPLGGPAFFYVTGLAGGFGYNRRLIVPDVSQIMQFPLVAEAMGRPAVGGGLPLPALPSSEGGEDGAQDAADDGNDQQSKANANLAAMRNKIMTEIEGIHRFIPPEVGEIFFAIGIKYTSFELLDSFALVTVAFGNRFELNVVGITAVSVPPGVEEGVPALVLIEVAVKASYLPAEGALQVKAVLTPRSHLFDPNCRLTGGFAFYSWFGGPRKGEFVLTIGGYHPKFKVPSYYPRVPRLGLSWIVNKNLSIKGGAYFAVTGHAFMAGGFLKAVYHSGSLKAWIKLAADFLLTYKPFHYSAKFSIDIGAQVTIHFFGTHHLSLDLNADLDIWGPSFTGKAKIHIWVASFTIHFGHAPQGPPPIDWLTFRDSFLPAGDDNILTITPVDGLINAIENKTLNPQTGKLEQKTANKHLVFNAKHFVMITNSVIPVTKWNRYNKKNVAVEQDGVEVGVAPMDLRKEMFVSTHDVKIERLSKHGGTVTRVPVSGVDFIYKSVLKEEVTVEKGDKEERLSVRKGVPAALWGNVFQPNINAHPLVADTLAGVVIVPRPKTRGGETKLLPRKNLAWDSEIVEEAYRLTAVLTPQDRAAAPVEATKAQLEQPAISKRNAMLAHLMDASLLPQANTTLKTADFIDQPTVEEIMEWAT